MPSCKIKCPECRTVSEYSERPASGSFVECEKCQVEFMYGQAKVDVSKFLFSVDDDDDDEEEEAPAPPLEKVASIKTDQLTQEEQEANKENRFRDNEKIEIQDDSQSEYEDKPEEEEEEEEMDVDDDFTPTTKKLDMPTFKPKMTLRSIQQQAAASSSGSSSSKIVIPSVPSPPSITTSSKGYNIPDLDLQQMNEIQHSASEEEDVPESSSSKKSKKKKKTKRPLFSDEEENDELDQEEEEAFTSRKRGRGAIDDIFSDLEEDELVEEEEKEQEQQNRKKKEKSSSSRNYTATNYLSREEKRSRQKLQDEVDMIYEKNKPKRKHRYIYKKDESGNATYEKVYDDEEQDTAASKADVPRKPKERRYKFGPKVGNRFNPFILFNKEYRKQVLEANPNLPTKALSTAVSEAYQNLSPAEKEKWTEYARKKREDYKEEYSANNINERMKRLKMPPTPYILFQKEQGPHIKEEYRKRNEVVDSWPKLLASIWKNLNEDDKQSYIDRSKNMREEFMLKFGDVYRQKMDRMNEKIRQTKLKNGTMALKKSKKEEKEQGEAIQVQKDGTV